MLRLRVSSILLLAVLSSCSTPIDESLFLENELNIFRDYITNRVTKQLPTNSGGKCLVWFYLNSETIYTIYDNEMHQYKDLRQANPNETMAVRVSPRAKIRYRCIEKHAFLNGVANRSLSATCTEGGYWKPPLVYCFITCPKLQSSNVEWTKCKSLLDPRIEEKDCYDRRLVYTKMSYKCKPRHHDVDSSSLDRSHDEEFTLLCNPAGLWNGKLPHCSSDCGVPLNDPLISNGEGTSFGNFPWHVAVYSVSRKNFLICGGTLIRVNLVLSAAHCFYNQDEEKLETDPKDYFIVVAKMTRNYTKEDNNAQKTFQISKIVYPEKSYNPNSTESADIAILVLKENIQISQYVRPVCFEMLGVGGFRPSANQYGVVPGWGYDENHDLKEKLQMAKLDFVHYNDCSKNITALTTDKFCGRTINGSKPESGDSGGGLVFKKDYYYYIRGLVSFNEAVEDSPLTAFTDISEYENWIYYVITNNAGD